ncbi:hypothetical protein F8M41_026591 [Gigaspora margarita]|uniref:Uncharacterized protein n=1 Tax=Gigaspora margarita TaxID=4874 RepID=A0A8H3XII1_GIGMA|nr:hypothetical protein F8M41_026591 [Gigaspora margarita]
MSSPKTSTDTSSATSLNSPIVIIIIVVATVALTIGLLVILYFHFKQKNKRKGLKPFKLSSTRVEPTPHKNITRSVDLQKHNVPSVVFDVTESEKRGSREKEAISEEESIGSPTLVREGLGGGLRRAPTRSMTMPMPSRGDEEFSSSEEEYDDDDDADTRDYSGVSQHQHFTNVGEP